MNSNVMSLSLVLAISAFILNVNGQSQLPGQFSRFSGALSLFGTFLDFAERFQKARLIEHPASGKCMNVEWSLFGSASKIIMYDCHWRHFLTPVDELFYFVNSDGAHLLKGAASYSNMCLYTGTNYNDPLYTTGCNTSDNKQQFDFRKVCKDEYLIVQRVTGRCLRAEGHGNGDGIRAVNCDCNDRDQKWRICTGSRDCNN